MKRKYTMPVARSSVLISIDVQADFCLRGAVCEVAGTMECAGAMRTLLHAYRKHALPIVHVVRLYRRDGSNVDACRKEAVESGLQIVAPGTAGAELLDDLKPDPSVKLEADKLLHNELQRLAPGEWAMYKPRWDAFYQTPLDAHLRSLGVDTVVIVGCNFPNCPRSTIYGASMRDFRIVMAVDAVSGVYDKGLEELRNIDVALMTTEQCCAWLERAGSAAVRRVPSSAVR